MPVETMSIDLNSKAHNEIHDITGAVDQAVRQSELSSGTVTIFSPSSTSGLTTVEYESGCVADLERMFEQIAPQGQEYQHNLRWQDGNGHSHMRAALLGPSLTVPFVDKRMTLGTWQQIIYVDFDNKPRSRSLVVQMIGE